MSKLILIAIALCVFACGLNAEPNSATLAKLLKRAARAIPTGGCGKAGPSARKLSVAVSQRIIGGVEAKPHSFPFIVSMQTSGSHFCGGSLIRVNKDNEATDMVITAAHCVYDGIDNVYVVAGAHDVSKKENTQQKVKVAEAYYNDKYDPDTTVNDIAVLILKDPIQFNENVQPICLPAVGDDVDAGSSLTVAGWGLTEEEGDDTSSILMQVSVPSVSTSSCQKSYKTEGVSINAEVMMCAGKATGGKDACQGDSGGPLFTGGSSSSDPFILRGVVSFGIGCGRPNMPGVYAKVSNYLPWVRSNIRVYSNLY